MFGLDMQGYAEENGLGDSVTAKYHIVGVLCIIAVCLMVVIPAIFPEVRVSRACHEKAVLW